MFRGFRRSALLQTKSKLDRRRFSRNALRIALRRSESCSRIQNSKFSSLGARDLRSSTTNDVFVSHTTQQLSHSPAAVSSDLDSRGRR
ncbi:hypothetical protein L596_018618 [Steinernema carpocapsae]|uniref:Uncharacterized protein n=1 Tax=Steinernema carpocapsae TaxID=34508 RepID=A0A4U5N566_STECR|nr:hypothetical protein L596_018618 [Steinernema carpocapsae]